jgi:hypothetical protein
MQRSIREEAAWNRDLIREVNDRALEAFALGDPDELELVCECGEISCFGTVRLTRAQYEALRESGGFVLVPEHLATAEHEPA